MQRTKPLNLKVNTGNAQKSVNALTSKLNQLQQNKRVRINVDTSQIDKATQSLNRLSQAQVRASQAHFSGKAQGLAQGKAQNTAQAGGMGIVGGLKGAFVALGGMAIVSEIKQTADAMMSLSSRIKLVTKDDAERLRVESALYNMSIKNRASLEDLGDLYYKTASTAKQFGASQEDVLKLTDIVSKSLIVGGADTAQQKATILQLSQALGSGVLQGDELRSLRENAPRLMQEIAKNMGTNMPGLKEMGAKGELTTERLMTAILQSGGAIESEFNRMTPTIGQSFTTLGNRWDKFILDIQNGSGIFGTIAEVILKGIDLIGEGIDFVSKEFGTATPEMMGMVQDFRDLWETMQPLIQALGKIFMNWVVPALKIFGKVAASVLGMVAQLLQPVVDLLGRIAGLIADASNGFSGLISKAESGAIEKYKSLKIEQNNNVNVGSASEAGEVIADSMPLEFPEIE
jgi:tape measure domain-containing protein